LLKRIQDQIFALQALSQDQLLLQKIDMSITVLSKALKSQLPVLIAGNGGSAADALHISGELVGKFLLERPALNVICLNSNSSVMTAWANDYSFEDVFARQVQAHGMRGGVFWGISTSGNSENILRGLTVARELEMGTIMLTGRGGGKASTMCDLLIDVPATETPRVQELHIGIYHYICEKLESSVQDSGKSLTN
jgi:D-sedoheptulose 7-phosphate isomerase